MALTKKKRLYADARLSGMPQKESAIFAEYSAASAAQAASRLEKDADVVAYMARERAVEASPVSIKKTLDTVKKKLNKQKSNVKSSDSSFESPSGGQYHFDDPEDYLLHVMNDIKEEPRLRLDAAKSLMPYKHGKVADQGKKEAEKDRAKQAGNVFAVGAPPKLVVNNK